MKRSDTIVEADCACLLKLYPLGEHGLIVACCSKEHGVIRAAARSARKPGSDFYGQLDLFYDCDILCTRPKSGDLLNLKSASLLTPRLELRRDLLKLRLASYMCAMILATVETGSAESCWYELISGALNYLNTQPASLAILRHFDKRLAQLHGLYTPRRDAYVALQGHFGHLPAGRDELGAVLS